MTHGIEKLGILVTCLNCTILWRRITEDDNPGGTVPASEVQKFCPNCNSNAWISAALTRGG